MSAPTSTYRAGRKPRKVLEPWAMDKQLECEYPGDPSPVLVLENIEALTSGGRIPIWIPSPKNINPVIPTITVGRFGAFALKLRMWFNKSKDGAPIEKTPVVTDDLHRERFSTAPTYWDEDDSRWGSVASESELRGFSDCRRESLNE